MRVYFDTERDTVIVGDISHYFKKGNLVAEAFGDDIAIKYIGSRSNETFLDYSQYQKEDGSSAGSDVATTLAYLNDEFNKTNEVGGESNFNLFEETVTVVDDRLNDGDVIYINPTINVINEIYFPTIVVNNSFTVRRVILNGLNGLTVNMPFRWRKLR